MAPRFSILASCALACVSAYEQIGTYMPVSNVLEHSQIIDDVSLFNEALKGDSPDYTKAEHIYKDGGGNSCKSSTKARTLQGFATKDLEGETFADAFYDSGNSKTFWDTWMLAALDGTGDFAGLSRTKRVTSLKKGVLGLVTFYASHELEAAIDKAAVEGETRSDAKSGHAWDEGWAFYYGPRGQNGEASPWEVAKKRDSDFPNGTEVSTGIVPYFNAGLIAVRNDTYDATAADLNRDIIYKMWAITYLRAGLKYLEIAENSYDEKAHAEGYAYYKAIDGWLSSKNSAAATAMRDALEITQTNITAGTFCSAKAAVDAALPDIGIDCTMLGTFKDSSINCPACSSATVTLPAGASAVAAVSGTVGDDVTCVPEDDDNGGASDDDNGGASDVASSSRTTVAASQLLLLATLAVSVLRV